MAQIARNHEAKKATDNAAELGQRTADQGADVAREAIDKTEDTARRGVGFAQQTASAALEVERAVTRRSTEGATEVGRVFRGVCEGADPQRRRGLGADPGVAGTRSTASRASSCAPASSARRRSPGATSRWCRRW